VGQIVETPQSSPLRGARARAVALETAFLAGAAYEEYYRKMAEVSLAIFLLYVAMFSTAARSSGASLYSGSPRGGWRREVGRAGCNGHLGGMTLASLPLGLPTPCRSSPPA